MAGLRPCPHCSRPMEGQRQVCVYCQQAGLTGVPAPAAPAWAAPALEEPEKRGGAVGAWIAAGLGACILLAGGVYALSRTGLGGPAPRGGGGGPSLVMVGGGGAAGGAPVTGAPGIDSKQIDSRLAGAAASTGGELEISLAWNALSDLDLQVRDPSGELINAWHPRSRSGGVQDVDANPTPVTEAGHLRGEAGLSPGRENVLPVPQFLVDMDRDMPAEMREQFKALMSSRRDGRAGTLYSRTPVEHVFFATAPKGTYTVLAHCYGWQEKDRTPVPFTVEVRSQGRVFHRSGGALGPGSFAAEGVPPVEVCRFAVK